MAAETLLVADCPRCSANEMTFDVLSDVLVRRQYAWQTWHEVFSRCLKCKKPTVFLISMNVDKHRGLGEALSESPEKLVASGITLNNIFDIERYISLRDAATAKAPEHTPDDVAAPFNEGATCYGLACYNAAGTMFRLSLDLATKPLLPSPDNGEAPQPNSRQRRDLGLRIPWLLEQGKIPNALWPLADCIREDGNDGAHAGTLKKEDAEDLMEFTEAVLERLYTEPERLRLAEARRAARRQLQ